MSKENKPKLKRMQIQVTEAQFEWLRKQSFVLRKPMTTIFRELVATAMQPAQAQGKVKDAEQDRGTIQG